MATVDPRTLPGLRYEDGVLVQDATAPSLAALRPVVAAEKDKFPVYDDLQDRFLRPADPLVAGEPDGADRVIARTLAVCSGYAYSDAPTVATMMARMGLLENRCRMIAMVNEAMFIVSTAFLVQSEDGRVVVLAYRGTEPLNFINWLTDADLSPTPVVLQRGNLLTEEPASTAAEPLEIHGGFYRNVRATRYKVMQTLARAAEGLPVTATDEDSSRLQPMEALYITGHSLGAAMAAIATLLLKNTPEHDRRFGAQLKATYSFAQPMVGNPALAAACNADDFLGRRLFRFVYERDPVPHLPSQDLGRYRNFGTEYGYDGRRWARREGKREAGQMGLIVNALGSGLMSLGRYLPVLRSIPVDYLLDDHRPHHYIEALTESGELTEFGDNVYA
jgi:hypothetical protein